MSIRDAVVIESSEDYLGLWSILWNFREVEDEKNANERRRKTFELLQELLEMDLIQPGTFTKDGDFELWNLSPTEALNRIVTEWEQLGREPTLGDIVWFIATEKGEQLANSLK